MMSRQYDNRGRDQINVENVGTVVFCEQTKPTRPRNEQILLKDVRDGVDARLAQSLHRAVLISLEKEAQPNQVTRPWERDLRIGLKPETFIPAEKTIAQIFDDPEITGKLLIIGQPGAGKTTALLELAKTLVERAQEDINQPIPIILSLSNWKNEKQTIREWIVAELQSKYGVSIKLGRQWVSDRKLLPLLDGLDEVASERQVSCINRINEFLTSEFSPFYVAVCSRLEAYKNLTNHLKLNGAVCLKELTNEQIRDYLTQLERPLLWKEISQNEDLLTLVRSPFLLSVTLLTYPEGSEDTLKQIQGSNNLLKFLLDKYIERMLRRQIDSPAYSKRKPPVEAETIKWLNWLASQMTQQSQTEFLIEGLQPSMLPNKQRYAYLPFMVLNAVLWSGVYFFINDPSGNKIILVVFAMLPFWFSGDSIKPLEELKWSWQQSRSHIRLLLLMVVIMVGMTAIQVVMRGLDWKFIPLSAFIFGVFFSLLGLLLGGIDGETVEQKLIPNQGIRQSAKNSITVGLLSGLFFGLVSAFLPTLTYDHFFAAPFLGMTDKRLIWLAWSVSMGFIFGLIGGSIGGGKACIQHLSLRFLLYQSKNAPWNYARFLDYCTERQLLQRVGGRYRFIHKYLQDHFANMPLKQPKD